MKSWIIASVWGAALLSLLLGAMIWPRAGGPLLVVLDAQEGESAVGKMVSLPGLRLVDRLGPDTWIIDFENSSLSRDEQLEQLQKMGAR